MLFPGPPDLLRGGHAQRALRAAGDAGPALITHQNGSFWWQEEAVTGKDTCPTAIAQLSMYAYLLTVPIDNTARARFHAARLLAL
jgi:hypothetical protein